MKKLLIVLVPVVLAIGCTSKNDNSGQNLALISKYVTAVENMDFEAMDTYLGENYLGLGPSYGDSINKAEAIESWKNNVENLYESIKYNRSRNIAITITSGDNQGDWVSNWAELEINYKNGDGPITIWANSIYQIENDKIVKSFTFYNEADALRQLGYQIIRPSDL